jgi:hypothetical protein
VSQELSDAEWLRKCAEDIDVACIDAIDAKESRRDAARLRSIAAKLERPAIDAVVSEYGGGWAVDYDDFIPAEQLAAMLGCSPAEGMPVKVAISPV